MVRPYAVKGKKRKKTKERYDTEEKLHDEGTSGVPENEQEEDNGPPENKHEEGYGPSENKLAEEEDEEEDEEEEEQSKRKVSRSIELDGIPIGLSHNKAQKKPRVIFVLEKASLENAELKRQKPVLLNPDEHRQFLLRKGKDPASVRPDIAHQALLMILDSPLNKSGMIKSVYVRTEKGVLIEINPKSRIPRTFNRFCGLMAQLLQNLFIKSSEGGEKLMRVVKNPVTQYLPVSARKIGLSYSSPKVVKLRDYVAATSDDTDLVFVVGAMAHGKIEADYIDDFVAVSQFPLSAAYCITMICQALEEKLNIW